MEIQKIFTDLNSEERLYSVLMTEKEFGIVNEVITKSRRNRAARELIRARRKGVKIEETYRGWGSMTPDGFKASLPKLGSQPSITIKNKIPFSGTENWGKVAGETALKTRNEARNAFYERARKFIDSSPKKIK